MENIPFSEDVEAGLDCGHRFGLGSIASLVQCRFAKKIASIKVDAIDKGRGQQNGVGGQCGFNEKHEGVAAIDVDQATIASHREKFDGGLKPLRGKRQSAARKEEWSAQKAIALVKTNMRGNASQKIELAEAGRNVGERFPF